MTGGDLPHRSQAGYGDSVICMPPASGFRRRTGFSPFYVGGRPLQVLKPVDLLNAWGYYVQYTSDLDERPGFLRGFPWHPDGNPLLQARPGEFPLRRRTLPIVSGSQSRNVDRDLLRRFQPETEIKGMDKSIVVNERARSAHSTMREQGSAAFDGRRRVEPDPPGGMSESSFPRPNINLHCVISDTDPRTINHIYQRRSMQLPPVLEFGCGNFHSTPGDSPA